MGMVPAATVSPLRSFAQKRVNGALTGNTSLPLTSNFARLDCGSVLARSNCGRVTMECSEMKSGSAISAGRTAPAAGFVFIASGFLVAPSTQRFSCQFRYETIDGCCNGFVEVTADPELVEPIAFSRTKVQLELHDLTFWCRIAGYNKVERRLLLPAWSFFAGMAAALRRR